MSATLDKHQLTEQTVTDLCQDEETVHAEQEVNLQVDKNIQIHELLLLRTFFQDNLGKPAPER